MKNKKIFFTRYKTQITDFFLFFSVWLISAGLHFLTIILKIKFSILKLKDQITEMNKMVVLLDKHALFLEQKSKIAILDQINSNMVTAAAIFFGVGITIAVILFFFWWRQSGAGGFYHPQ